MAKAITYNNAGIVEAIKRKSGSTKFYKASYQGIIEAIEDWHGGGGDSGGGGGTSVLPPGTNLPNTDNTAGDLVVVPNGDGDYFMYVFANGAWERLHVTTEEVETAGSAPFALVTDDGVTVKNQKDINAYLDERITKLSEKGYDDGPITERIEALEEEVEALPVTVADTPPDGEDGDLWFKSTEDSLQLYVFYGDDWTVASPPVSTDDIDNALSLLDVKVSNLEKTTIIQGQSIADQQSALFNLGKGVVALQEAENNKDLQTVLDNGNVADKGAEFGGPVVVEPGRAGNEAVTYSQLLELEEEIEQLLPTTERGSWDFKMTCGNLDGEFCMTSVKTQAQYQKEVDKLDEELAKCLTDNADDPVAGGNCTRDYQTQVDALVPAGTKYNTDDFSVVTEITFSGIDANGVVHTFADIEKGQMIDLLSEDSGYLVAEVTKAPSGMWYEDKTIGVKVVRFKGVASGRCRIKVFSVSEELDPQEFDMYLRKTGDEMSGPLDMKFNPIENAGRFEHEVIETLTSNTKRAKDIYMYQRDGKGEAYLGINGTVWLPSLNATQLDLDGNQIPWQNVQVGDYIKVNENGHSTRRYSIFGPVTKVSESELDGILFFSYEFENHHAIINGPLVIRANQRVTISRVEVSGNQTNIITDQGGEIHGRVVIRHPGAGPVEIHASDIGDNYNGSGIQIFGMEDKKFVEISSGSGRLKCWERDGSFAKANAYEDVVTRGYLIKDYGSYNHIPSGFEYELKYVEDEADAKAKARTYGNWAITNNGLYVNHLDRHRLVDLSTYYTSNQGTFANPGDLEGQLVEDDAEFSDSDELVIDYKGIYEQRNFLSVYQEHNRDRLGLRRVYAIGKVTYYKNEPFIKLEWTKRFSMDGLWYAKCILNLPGII